MKKFYKENNDLIKLKKFFENLNLFEVDLWPIISPYLYTEIIKKKRSFFYRLSRILKFIFLNERFILRDPEKNKILASFFLRRKDHHQQFLENLKSFKKKEIMFLEGIVPENKIKYFLKRFNIEFIDFKKSIKVKRYFEKNFPLKKDLFYYFLLFRTLYEGKKINNFNKIIKKYSPKALISYNNAGSTEDNALTLLMKNRKKKTFSLQSWMFREYEKLDNTDCIFYDNYTSDYILVWGKNSADILKKHYPKNKILIVGNSKFGRIKKAKEKNHMKKGVVFLSNNAYEKSNLNLIKILNEISKKRKNTVFYLKLHPDNDRKKYLKLISKKNIILTEKFADNNNLFEKSDFIIVHNSTISSEVLRHQIPRLRFKDKHLFVDSENPQDLFENLEELEKLMEKLKNPRIYKKYLQKYKKLYSDNFFQSKLSPEDYIKKIIIDRI